MSNPLSVQAIPLSQLQPDPNQPRRYISPSSIQAMAASLSKNGQRTPIKVRPLTESEKAQFAPAQYLIIGGHRRYEGAKAAGLPALNALVQGTDQKQANLDALIDNELEDMTWLDKDLALAYRAKTYELSTREIAEELRVSQSQATQAIRLATRLIPQTIELIDRNLAQTPPDEAESEYRVLTYTLTRKVVLALTALEDPQKLEEALKVVLDKRMTESQTKALVASIKAGNAKGATTEPLAQSNRVPQLEASEQMPTHTHTHAPKPAKAKKQASSEPVLSNPQPLVEAAAPKASAASSQEPSPGTLEKAGWDLLAGLPVATQIRTKIKKGERPTWKESLILVADLLWRVLVWTAKHLWKVIHWFGKTLWKMVDKIAKHPLKTFSEAFQAVRVVLIFAFLGLGSWMLFDHYIYNDAWQPIRTITSWVHSIHASEKSSVVAATPAPTAVPVTEPVKKTVVAKAKAKPTPVQTPVPTKVVQITPNAKGNNNGPLAQSTHVAQLVASQQTPTPKPQGDIISQGADAATKGAGLMKAFGL